MKENTVMGILKKRNVNALYHFTQADNILSIMTRGILPKRTLESRHISFRDNDKKRLDGCENASCVSVSFPNGKLFWRFRKQNRVNWVVFEIEPDVLSGNCTFCNYNAASSSTFRGKGASGLEKMFGNRIGEYPESEQAEVLVFDEIPVGKIRKAIFIDQSTLQKYKSSIPLYISCVVDSKFFSTREFCKGF
ncbi:MAG: DUF4433 domain-containing protein [Lachnospiraceae bacterium]|nr:DUF4433 domain-containing protein [Lachnospiraceae bacterium]